MMNLHISLRISNQRQAHVHVNKPTEYTEYEERFDQL
jgi:hypothetical protein